jgi:hypothetical protein
MEKKKEEIHITAASHLPRLQKALKRDTKTEMYVACGCFVGGAQRGERRRTGKRMRAARDMASFNGFLVTACSSRSQSNDWFAGTYFYIIEHSVLRSGQSASHLYRNVEYLMCLSRCRVRRMRVPLAFAFHSISIVAGGFGVTS